MVDKTLSELITEVQQELYQVAGVAVQVYSEELIAQKLRRAFDYVYEDFNWKRFQTYETYTLDETTGRVTTPIATTFSSYEDILRIYPADSDAPLTKFSMERNPLKYTGNRPLQYLADSVNVIKVVPATATGDIVIVGQLYPGTLALDTVVPFDSHTLVMFAAWQYCVGDAANSAQAEMFQGMFETRLKQLKMNQSTEPISLSQGGTFDRPPTNWTER